MSDGFHFYDETALLERLSNGLKRRAKEVIFLVGSPLSAPKAPGKPGVPGVSGVIDLVRREFENEPAQLSAFENALTSSGQGAYQTAFLFLQGRRGQQTANDIIRAAVCSARLPSVRRFDVELATLDSDQACRLLDFDTQGWTLNEGVEALGKLVTAYPGRFGGSLLTTNFDPLIEVAIRRAGGSHFRTTLHADGNLSQTEGDGCHVIHLHGYWYGSDTLHTTRQLTQPRPRLRASLSHLLRDKMVVVSGYGGWDDAFTEALMSVVLDDTAYPEIIWTFYPDAPYVPELLSERLSAGIDRGRVSLYAGIDCNSIFPKLYECWRHLEVPSGTNSGSDHKVVRVTEVVRSEIEAHLLRRRADQARIIEGDDEDRPPLVEICVGRDIELKRLENSNAHVAFLTGIGGQGKSTLAAKYFEKCQSGSSGFSLFVWRDCKEQSERFENQLASVIESLSLGRISGKYLAEQSAESIVDMLMNVIREVNVLFVFDNVDDYVDLDAEKMTGTANLLIDALLRSDLCSRAVFTCRRSVTYDHTLALSCPVTGIDLESATRLFADRGASCDVDEIKEAHALTEGHAFWLDLMAIQVAKRQPAIDLTQLVAEIRLGGGTLPLPTLSSIWATLRERERIVLRAMAETVKPETEVQIGNYLRDELNYNKFSKALSALRALNLIVVKPRPGAADLLELHPLVRQFVRVSFKPEERLSYIDAIIRVYRQFIASHKLQLEKRPPLSLLQYWTQNAELDIAAGKMDDAFSNLSEVADAFSSSAYPREFCRAARLLFATVDWVAGHRNFKAFKEVFRAHVRNLSYLGEDCEVDRLLDMYEKTLPKRDARFIDYCEMRCTSNWIRREYTAAVAWGKLGQDLAVSSSPKVDAQFDIAHALALAERDSGQPELALPVFLDGRTLAEVTDPDELDEIRGGAYYGNVGRCLHLMDQIASALVCYQKSAILVEKDTINEHMPNQGYIRAWIGELLAAREEFKLAGIFLRAAYLKWAEVSPRKAAQVMSVHNQLRSRSGESFATIEDREIEGICLNWILGRNADSQHRIASGAS